MMKKQFFLALPLFALVSCGSAAVVLKPSKAITIDTASENFVSFFAGTYRIDSEIQNLYTKVEYSSRDEVSPKGKVNISYDADGNVLSETHIISNAGIAVEQYLDISNRILTRDVGNGSVSFKGNYGSPLSTIMGSVAAVDSYFTHQIQGGIAVYDANELGLAKAASGFSTFFSFYGDTYTWDDKTLSESIEDLHLESDEEGQPKSMSFTKVKKDRFGGIRETYTCSLEPISSVTSLQPYTYQGSEESKNKLVASLNNLATAVATGNFTETIDHPYIASTKEPYHNFYQFDETGYGAMLSDIPFYEETYGTTYLGMAYSSTEGYYMVGVSPDSEYSGAASTTSYNTLAETLPQISSFSVEFMEYDEESDSYIFDMDSFLYDDYAFDFTVLDFLYGKMDPCADKFGYFLSDDVWYAFNFHTLTIKIDAETNLPTFALCYEDSYKQDLTVTSNFSDFGTTNMRLNKELSKAYSLLVD